MPLTTLQRINNMLARIYPLATVDPNNPLATQVQILAAKLQTLAGGDLPTNADSLSDLYTAMLALQETDARVAAWLMQLAIWQDGEPARIIAAAQATQSVLATQFQQQLQQHSVDEDAKIAAIQKQASADAAGFQQMFAQLKDVDLGDAGQFVQLFQLVATLTGRVDGLAAIPLQQTVRQPLPSLLASATSNVVIMLPKPYTTTNYTITGLVFEVPNLNLLQVTNIVRAKDRVTLTLKNLSVNLQTTAGTIHLSVQPD
jgi:hypothetical protein